MWLDLQKGSSTHIQLRIWICNFALKSYKSEIFSNYLAILVHALFLLNFKYAAFLNSKIWILKVGKLNVCRRSLFLVTTISDARLYPKYFFAVIFNKAVNHIDNYNLRYLSFNKKTPTSYSKTCFLNCTLIKICMGW